ncbi:hypothetical protein N9J72_01060 [Candidatus Gracilibacteria bacterium]|nr:hypothetical protein [Candidatus Gracilibacteria bacterium]
MKTEIERKFLVAELPDLQALEKISYERYFLFCNEQSEIRIQKKGEKYEFERKLKYSELSAEKQKFEISKPEFFKLKEGSIGEIIRESYVISTNPEISLKIYYGDLEGFQRIEVEFENAQKAESFKAPKWFGKEITGKTGSRDFEIINKSFKQLKNLL